MSISVTDDYLRTATSITDLLWQHDIQVIFFLGAPTEVRCPLGIQASVLTLREDFDADLALEILLSMLRRSMTVCVIAEDREVLDEFSKLYLWYVYGLSEEDAWTWVSLNLDRCCPVQ